MRSNLTVTGSANSPFPRFPALVADANSAGRKPVHLVSKLTTLDAVGWIRGDAPCRDADHS
eukprot:CAMPEP_0181352166 /NCGR_PEP_ID=MMETSP1106-20121128/2163_1 /TAXON_ID=81844 /ORGANISM="Mantoniella antarctica, Strain SL-175" /LENGTH=60 /DNA_ID=CAMNT_0023464705 /DNA_START=1044 /DNA_END=1226 /DNA_ORIENTATION=-